MSLVRGTRLNTSAAITNSISIIRVCKIKDPSLALTNILLLFVVYFQGAFDGDECSSTLINRQSTYKYLTT
jgi:hypothetical protein